MLIARRAHTPASCLPHLAKKSVAHVSLYNLPRVAQDFPLSHLCDMGIAFGGFDGRMSEKALDIAKIHIVL